ncbi:hypothetical protein CSB45_01495 [candidate division KSB3 bacterium]|uniref:FAD-binding PCMH-type domain-containing protein n=1 Tax=candidate division KSB3 bacterium TaxID=2044937 RepID=A0A2G6EBH4_9BACT|nr:MAG: hypothetical protein CSB45_01495 [candidate division KSB3 bacterium]PIE30730.1 MAG: hypothetical protein CSA57_01855 [candidate division KSB3 bacterium]
MKNTKEFFTPTTLHEASTLLREHPGKGVCIAGGTNLLVEKNPEIDYLVNLLQLGLDYIREDAEFIRIGACTTIEDLYHSKCANSLAGGLFAQAASWFAGKQVRNVATIGGNVADGRSGADMIPLLLAMEARVIIAGETERFTAIADFIKKGGERLQKGEVIKEFLIPKVYQAATGKFLKNTKTHEDISTVSVTTLVLMQGELCKKVRIALGAVAPTAIRIPQAEACLEGQKPTKDRLQQAVDMVVQHIHPIDNFRAGAQFRRDISRAYTRQALSECVKMA